jgi:hypothetical protein
LLAPAPPGRIILAPIPAAKANAPAVFMKSRLVMSLALFFVAIVFLLSDIKNLVYFAITLIFQRRGGDKSLAQIKPRMNPHFDQVCRMSNVQGDKAISFASLLHNKFGLSLDLKY